MFKARRFDCDNLLGGGVENEYFYFYERGFEDLGLVFPSPSLNLTFSGYLTPPISAILKYLNVCLRIQNSLLGVSTLHLQSRSYFLLAK